MYYVFFKTRQPGSRFERFDKEWRVAIGPAE